MVLRGHIRDGKIVIDEPAQLPEGAAVRIEVVDGQADKEQTTGSLLDFAGRAADLPRDASAQPDHYLYGTPKD